MWVKWIYFYNEVELAVVWHETGEDAQLDREERIESTVLQPITDKPSHINMLNVIFILLTEHCHAKLTMQY